MDKSAVLCAGLGLHQHTAVIKSLNTYNNIICLSNWFLWIYLNKVICYWEIAKEDRCTASNFKPNDLLKQLFSSDVIPPGICVTCLNQAFSCVSMCSHSELKNGIINSFPFFFKTKTVFNHRLRSPVWHREAEFESKSCFSSFHRLFTSTNFEDTKGFIDEPLNLKDVAIWWIHLRTWASSRRTRPKELFIYLEKK